MPDWLKELSNEKTGGVKQRDGGMVRPGHTMGLFGLWLALPGIGYVSLDFFAIQNPPFMER